MNARQAFIVALAASALVLTASEARAEGFGAFALFGFNAEAEFDDIEFEDDNGRSLSFDLDEDEDLEDNLGLAVTYDTPVADKLSIGGVLALVSANGDESDADYLTLDLGFMAIFRLPAGKLSIDLMASVGPTLATIEDVDDPLDDFEFSGLGFFLMGGVLVEYPVSRDISLVGGLLFSRHAVGELSDEREVNGTDITVTLEDGVATRALFTLGAMFH